MATGARSGRSEVTGVDGAPVSIDDAGGSITVDGTVDVGNLPDPINVNVTGSDCEGDCEYLLLTDTGNDTDFLRQICTDCDGTETVTDTELDGVTPYAVTAEANVRVVLRGALRDTEIMVLCDTGNANKPYLQRYTFNNNGTIRSSAELELDGTAYAGFVGPAGTCATTVDDGGGSITVDGVVQVDDKVRVRVLCDLQADQSVVEFVRTYEFDETGAPTGFTDTELDGSTPYVITGTVRDCAVAAVESADCQSGFGGPAVITGLSASGASYTTSALARRITINYQANSASGANRPTISVNGGAAKILGKNGDQSQIIFGTLDTCNTLGYTLTITVNQNNQDIDIIEEF